jgi:hypothetical protein
VNGGKAKGNFKDADKALSKIKPIEDGDMEQVGHFFTR